jgi:hypothetical protein
MANEKRVIHIRGIDPAVHLAANLRAIQTDKNVGDVYNLIMGQALGVQPYSKKGGKTK